jgi:hypothetical protein
MDVNQPLTQQNKVIRIKKYSDDNEKLLSKTFKEHEICIFFEKSPSEDDIDKLKDSFRDDIDPAQIEVIKCDNCGVPVVIFKAPNIHTFINTKGVRKSSGGPRPPVVGENYSLNFYNQIPLFKNSNKQATFQVDDATGKKNEIVIAVLDTGIDLDLVESKFLWKKQADADPYCYKDAQTGWNFVRSSASSNGGSDFRDDNPGKHGTVVSKLIINQFKNSGKNAVKIMPLKTHDDKGFGDLFGITCAIYFAVANGADIINASWGFYYYYDGPIPYIQDLIAHTLKEKGIVFVTAAGNKVDDDEEIAKKIYEDEYGIPITDEELRDLSIHNFYPALLSSKENSVITVTTTDGTVVSPTQNYSNLYADLGVKADEVSDGTMKFRDPFLGDEASGIAGSSFATAIATGIIGVHYDKNKMFNKSEFLKSLPLIVSSDLIKRYIKEGACIVRQD